MCRHHQLNRGSDAGGPGDFITGAVAAVVMLIILMRACV